MRKRAQFLLGVLLILATQAPATSSTEYNDTFLQQTVDFIAKQLTLFDGGVTRLERDSSSVSDSSLSDLPEIFTVDQLRQGWVVLHVIGAIYFFILLATVCDYYFLPTVECICSDLNLPKDVAAATFMATATTMPEFFTNTISTLLIDSDMGVGTVIGSLMFNTLGVAGLAALAIKKPVQLDWWPIARDCCIYTFNTIILIIIAWGGTISFVDSCVAMGFLVVYYVLTFNNNKFMPAIRVFIEDKMNCCFSTRYDLTQPPEHSAKAKLPLNEKKDPVNGHGLFVINLPEPSPTPSTESDNNSFMSSTANLTHSKHDHGDDNHSAIMPTKLFSLPRGETPFMKFWWGFTLPIKLFLACIIPNPRRFRKLYPLTFIMCIIVIGCNAYMIVWMITAIGVAIRVPDIIMGMTFLAAGSNMPEAVSSIISLRNGENGIGVSNSLGANSLAILLSLGLPWFIKNCMIKKDPSVPNYIVIGAPTIEINILILIFCTISLFVVLSFSGYRLTKRAGIALFVIYTIFIVIQILIQMNIIFPSSS